MSLTVDILSGELIPEELEKFELIIPISWAFSFIKITNSSSDPAIPSARAIHASFPDETIIPLNRFSTEISSPTIINIEEYPASESLHAFSETINLSSKLISLFFNKSNTTIDVIILVIDAGKIFRSASFSYKILPDR